MIMNKALEKAKRNDEEKVGLNIKIPIGLKNEFEELCKSNGVSMTAMMLSLIEVVVEESKGNSDKHDFETLKKINERIIYLEDKIFHLERNISCQEDADMLSKYQEEVERLKRMFN